MDNRNMIYTHIKKKIMPFSEKMEGIEASCQVKEARLRKTSIQFFSLICGI
jgi:hypothetical protein